LATHHMWRMVLFSNISKMLCFEQNVQEAKTNLSFFKFNSLYKKT
jgi:hypothetical protein